MDIINRFVKALLLFHMDTRIEFMWPLVSVVPSLT
jgi:hypothetical protein